MWQQAIPSSALCALSWWSWKSGGFCFKMHTFVIADASHSCTPVHHRYISARASHVLLWKAVGHRNRKLSRQLSPSHVSKSISYDLFLNFWNSAHTTFHHAAVHLFYFIPEFHSEWKLLTRKCLIERGEKREGNIEKFRDRRSVNPIRLWKWIPAKNLA